MRIRHNKGGVGIPYFDEATAISALASRYELRVHDIKAILNRDNPEEDVWIEIVDSQGWQYCWPRHCTVLVIDATGRVTRFQSLIVAGTALKFNRMRLADILREQGNNTTLPSTAWGKVTVKKVECSKENIACLLEPESTVPN